MIFAIIFSLFIFYLLFNFRYTVFDFFIKQESIENITTKQIQELQSNITEKNISKKDKEAIRNELVKYKDFTLYLYDEETLNETSYSDLENQTYVETTSFWLTLYEPKVIDYTIQFHDGMAYLLVYSYIGLSFMTFYVIFSLLFSIVLFVVIIMTFIHRKMKYVLSIKEEMQYIETGEFDHPIVYKGNDELTDLAKQLHHLRTALYQNMVKEEEARTANYELVTAMSHDLRTPLTSLLGYLDILRMKIYKNDETRDEYIEKSHQKAKEIKELSDKLFNHFLVYSQDEEVELHPMQSNTFIHKLELYLEDLQSHNYKIMCNIDKHDWVILSDETLLQRVFGNIFSNIQKYASKELITVVLYVEKEYIKLRICNRKKKDTSQEESTKIGLKSIDKNMKSMNGSFTYENLEDEFIVELRFCITQKNK